LKLLPGDLLFIPRGWVHDAESEDEASLHITLGLHPPMGHDLLSAAVDLLSRQHPEFRELFPDFPINGTGRKGRVTAALRRLTHLLATIDVDQVVEYLEDDLIRLGRVAGSGSMIEVADRLGKLTLNTTVVRRTHIRARMVDRPSGVGVQFMQSLVECPIHYTDALRVIVATADRFLIGELPGLSDDEQIRLVSCLLAEGLLEV
jgi:hypothetical protein